MFKPFLLPAIIGAFAFACTSLASAEDDLKERIRRKIAVQAAVGNLQARLEELSGGVRQDQVTSLVRAMEADTAKHSTTSASRQLATEQAAAELRDALQKAQAKVLEQASVGLPSKISEAELRGQFKDLDQKFQEAVTRFQQQHFAGLFGQARQRAVDNQHSQMKIQIAAPDEAELNQALNANPSWAAHRSKFAADLKRKSQVKDLVLFEENDDRVEEAIERVLSDVGKQVEQQFTAARDAVADKNVPTTLILAGEIREHATASVATALQSGSAVKAESISKKYGVLAAVSQALARDADKLERTRFEQFIPSDPVKITSHHLQGEIAKSPARHRTPSASLAQFEEHWTKWFASKVLEEYAKAKASRNSAASQRELTKLLAEDQCGPLLKERLRLMLAAESKPARAAVVQLQLSKHFATLGPAWSPADDAITAAYDNGRMPSEFSQSLALLGRPAPAEALLEETERRVVQVVNERLAANLAALRAQLNLVGNLESQQSTQIRREIEAGANKSKLIKKHLAKLHESWKGEQDFATHQSLFRRTEVALEKVISQHFDAIAQQKVLKPVEEAARAQAMAAARAIGQSRSQAATKSQANQHAGGQSGAGASGVGSGSGAGTGGGNDGGGLAGDEAGGEPSGRSGKGPPPDCVFELANLPGNRCQAAVTFPAALGIRQPFCDFDPVAIDDSAATIQSAIAPAIEGQLIKKLAAERARGGKQSRPFVFRVQCDVRSDAIRHKMSLQVRSGIETRFQQWMQTHAPEVNGELHWADAGT